MIQVKNPKPPPIVREVSFRKLNDVDIDSFLTDLYPSELCHNPSQDLDALVSQFNGTLSRLVEKHAPLKTRSMVERPIQPWFNDDIK